MNAASKAARTVAKPVADYVVKDVGLADWGRKDIATADRRAGSRALSFPTMQGSS